MTDDERLQAEQRARRLIDEQLTRAGWVVQDLKDQALGAAVGVAVREVTMKSGHGRADYLLYLNKGVVGVVEAKPMGKTLSGVEWQSSMYAQGLTDAQKLRATMVDGKLPFVFEASGSETHFTNGYDPHARARAVFNFPKPETLLSIIADARTNPDAPTWRGALQTMPELDERALRPAQITAITGIERSLREQRFDRSLVQMATGAGKTYTAVTASYRLLRFGGFKRVLFLVDRNNLADQTAAEFTNFRTPDDGRRFTELYPVDKLKSDAPADSASVVISTIQRVFKTLRGEKVPAGDDAMLDSQIPDKPVTVTYNAALPPETFDLIIVDEAHRSIYGQWRAVLEYFDAHVIGLTATPGKQTFAFFRQNLVSEYTYEESVSDGVNVDFEIFRIETEVTAEGSRIEAGTHVPLVDRRTREKRMETLDEDVVYTPTQLDRMVTSTSQIRLVLETYRDKLFTHIFPGRSEVPKTLIFAKDDAHAEEIVRCVREVFGRGNEFAAKITYSAKDPKGHLKAFRTSSQLRVAVTVDMIATGTDVKPLECVIFMRDVSSGQYFEQMKGRGARTISKSDFQAVTPDAEAKTHFVLVDAVGVTEHEFVAPPLNREPGISLEKLLKKAAAYELTEDETATLASRLAALERQVSDAERAELDDVAGPSSDLGSIVRGLVHAVNPDVQAAASEGAPDPAAAVRDLLDEAVAPLANNPVLRSRIMELRRQHDRIIDEVTRDTIRRAEGVSRADSALEIVESWKKYLEDNRDEITALQVLDEFKTHRVPFKALDDLARQIERSPQRWTTEKLWAAYEQLDGAKVRPNPHARATDLVSLLRYALDLDDELVPYEDVVQERYESWLAQQAQAGATFSETERWWLDRMRDFVVTSAGITVDALDAEPFTQRGGIDGALRDLGANAGILLESLDKELTA
ncbi:DEAD/DEAH box helicase family protein [Dermacoccus nishinomiyaensis]|uniref:type I restriction endonuclease subunit R n=1 Tax=Dermacoccus nishinomiyaensis TaxID=1274 RepID=UPI001F50AB0A|nr:DEAD/DEAH box helicase family protein [Dermacoccus nishinomiyaensis]MCI0154728.1 DEAD/DEAH box helicase family protein [Dermacoccus nishinomiyaensis]